jgi:hypothetical protein
MSAAATAAGYLYASGRLRGRAGKEQQQEPEPRRPEKPKEKDREPRVKVAVYEPQERPKRTPKIEYRTRRWRPPEQGNE